MGIFWWHGRSLGGLISPGAAIGDRPLVRHLAHWIHQHLDESADEPPHRPRKSMRRYVWIAVGALSSASFGGCQLPDRYVAEPQGELKGEMLVIESQVCLPVSAVDQVIGISSADRYGPDGESRSEGSGVEVSKLKTSSGEPVFEVLDATRPIDRLGYAVTPVRPVRGPTFVFFLSHPPLSATWTEWEMPQAKAPYMNAPLWGPNRVTPNALAGADAPRMRFRLVLYRDYFRARDEQATTVLPPC